MSEETFAGRQWILVPRSFALLSLSSTQDLVNGSPPRPPLTASGRRARRASLKPVMSKSELGATNTERQSRISACGKGTRNSRTAAVDAMKLSQDDVEDGARSEYGVSCIPSQLRTGPPGPQLTIHQGQGWGQDTRKAQKGVLPHEKELYQTKRGFATLH